MTREEANKKINAGMNIIDALEALGLIKFDDVRQETVNVNGVCVELPIELLNKFNRGEFGEMIKTLYETGYKIVKLEKNTTVTFQYSATICPGKYNGKLIEINQE